MQFTEAPKMSIKRKKKATEAVAVGFSTDVPALVSILYKPHGGMGAH
jgi:hypothetical protein